MSKTFDVRMSGFRSRSPVSEVLNWIDNIAMPLSRRESIPLEFAARRILAEELKASIDVPEFDRSAMDGYALRAEETVGAGEYCPLPFRLVGEALPGTPFPGTVGGGQAVRIMTGAAIPAGADAVVPAEFARESAGIVEICVPVSSGRHIGRRAEDIASGTVVLPRYRRLRPQDLAVAASLGFHELEVLAQPVVRIVVTGNELVAPGAEKGPHQVYEANSYLLRGLVARDSGCLENVRHCRDDAGEIRAALLDPGADVILISGGSSVGKEDWAPVMVREHGELPIHGIAMRPSSPAGLGRIGTAVVCLLPGNPVSCLCAYDFFAGRIIRLLAGLSPEWPYRTRSAPLLRKIVSNIGRVDYCRVKFADGGVEPLAISGASILSSTTRADGFVIVDSESEGLAAGSDVLVHLYDG